VRKRADCANEILPQLHNALLSHTALEWEQIFAQDVPSAAARSIADMFDHPQVLAEDMVTNLEHPSVGRYKGLTKAIKFSKTPGPSPFAAPTLGEHSDDVLAECGYSHNEIAQLRQQGVIK
jgi:crotonobetainyl-CoA:carnitine CoA-transferase CaiB-like acyl-CoA transferase